jgi:hypothetical protein
MTHMNQHTPHCQPFSFTSSVPTMWEAGSVIHTLIEYTRRVFVSAHSPNEGLSKHLSVHGQLTKDYIVQFDRQDLALIFIAVALSS